MNVLKLEFGEVALNFIANKPILINPSQKLIFEALKFVFSPNFDNEAELFLNRNNIDEVKVKFSLNNESDPVFVAFRSKSNINQICCKEDGDLRLNKFSAKVFRSLFKTGYTDAELVFMQMTDKIHDDRNFLKEFCCFVNRPCVFDDVCEKYRESENRNIGQEKLNMLENALYITGKIKKSKRQDHFEMLLKLIDSINTIYADLTNKVYGVKFLIHSDYIMEDLSVSLNAMFDEKFLVDVTTVIINHAGMQETIWVNAQPYLRSLLYIAYKIAMAKILKTKLLFFEDLTALETKEHLFFLEEKATEMLGESETSKWQTKQILKNICEVCKRLEISIIILFDGLFTGVEGNIIVKNDKQPGSTFDVIQTMDYKEIFTI